jgi:hypothetical protein
MPEVILGSRQQTNLLIEQAGLKSIAYAAGFSRISSELFIELTP